jgi:4-hydroxy-tetrahydrodipicolinate reductase
MGSLACAWVREEKDLEFVAEIELEDDLRAALTRSRAEVALDFTTAASARTNALAIVEAGVRPVVGTSGLAPADVDDLRAALEKRRLGGLVVPNFSIGAVLAMRFAEQAARFLPAAEIVEAHHATKADAPSGTARATAERIAAARTEVPPEHSHELVERVRGGRVSGIPVHSLRIPGVLARQEVVFGGEGETLSIRHETTDRSCFRAGILLAVRAAPRLKGLVVGLDSLLS